MSDIWGNIEPLIGRTQLAMQKLANDAEVWALRNAPWPAKREDITATVIKDSIRPGFQVTNNEGWRETAADGQSGIAKITMEHFSPIIDEKLSEIWS